MELITRFIREEEGQGLAEYGLILALVAIAVIGVVTALGGSLFDKFKEVVEALGGEVTEEGPP